MSKAILMMEMPESCITCQLYKFSFERTPMCAGNVKAIPHEDYLFGKKADFCPLKLLPKFADTAAAAFGKDYERMAFCMGYNQCLRDIGGSDE